jgi:hypothetical protein
MTSLTRYQVGVMSVKRPPIGARGIPAVGRVDWLRDA